MQFIRFSFLAGFLAGGLYHAYLSFGPVNPGRHLVFVLINFLGTGLMTWNRPRALLLFVPLILQQLFSHGEELIVVWQIQHKIDWPSVIVLLTMPILGVFVFRRNR